MKITKFEHACLYIENNGSSLLLDPGSLCKDLSGLRHIDAIFYTHQHADHCSTTLLQSLLQSFPKLQIFCPQDVVVYLAQNNIQASAVSEGTTVTVNSFTVQIVGQYHAIIYETIPCMNVGLLINEELYYPGDSFTLPPLQPKVLAVPASAPWMKTSEAIDFIQQVNAKKVIPTHNGLLSDFGKEVTYRWLENAVTQQGSVWSVLEPSESLETDS